MLSIKSLFPPTITNLPHQKWFFFFEIFFCIAIIPIKLSISLMLMRVAGPKKNYTYALWGMASLFILANTISFLYILLRCTPISFAWNTTTPGGSCLPSRDLADVYYADTAVNILTDWFCALMYVLPFPYPPNPPINLFFFHSSPLPLLYTLQLNLNAKLSVGFLLSLGILASLSACIRLKYTVNLNNSDDYLYSVADVMIWGYAENGVGFIVGCVSTLRPLFREMFSLGGGNHSGGSGAYAGYYDGGEDGGRLHYQQHGKVSYLREREEEEELDLHPYYNTRDGLGAGSGAAGGRGVGKPSLTCQTKTSITCSQHPLSPPLSPHLTNPPPPTTTTTTTTTTPALGSKPTTRKPSSDSTSTCEEHILHSNSSNHSLHSLHSLHSHHSDQELYRQQQPQPQQQRFSAILSVVDSTHHHHWRRGGNGGDRTDGNGGGAGAGMHGIQVSRSVHQTIA